MLSCQFQNLVVAWIVVVAEPLLFEAVILCGSLLQLLGHSHPSDDSEHRTITASNAMLYSCRTHGCGHQQDRVSVRYRDTFGARRPPSSRALPSHPVFHEKKGNSVHHGRRAMGRAMAARASKKTAPPHRGLQIRLPRHKVSSKTARSGVGGCFLPCRCTSHRSARIPPSGAKSFVGRREPTKTIGGNCACLNIWTSLRIIRAGGDH
jgi:hypothetical protein